MNAASVLVLTAAAGVPDLAIAAAVAALGAGAGTPLRLAASAVEIEFSGPQRSSLMLPGVDINIVPAAGRRKRLLIADMDSTIIGVECIDELADLAGVGREVAAITEAAMRGELDFEGALVARVALLRGLPEAALDACYDTRVHLNPGARVLARTMAAMGAETALVSGGFSFFSERVAAAAGFTVNQANRLIVKDGRLDGTIARPILGRAAKREVLDALAAQGGFAASAAIAVGDGANDLDMIKRAGLGVAYRAKPALAAEADARLDHSDLTALLALQGIPLTEWVH